MLLVDGCFFHWQGLAKQAGMAEEQNALSLKSPLTSRVRISNVMDSAHQIIIRKGACL
jgi:hypothetical protein